MQEQQAVEVPKKLYNVLLPSDGLNTVNVPKGGEVLGVVVSMDYDDTTPVLAVYADCDVSTEPRDFFVTMGALPGPGQGIRFGKYLGFIQSVGHRPYHVWEAHQATAAVAQKRGA